jgi:hypothetical protein
MMLSDSELVRLRRLFVDACVQLPHDPSAPSGAAVWWGRTLIDATPENIRQLLDALRGTEWHTRLLVALIEIGTASARDILAGVPAPIDEVKDTRWQLRRELERAVEGMSDHEMQKLVWRVAGVLHGRMVIGVDDLTDEDIEAIRASEIPEHLRWTSDDLGDGGEE